MALAQCIHLDATDFGDLPRPRTLPDLTTNPLTLVAPGKVGAASLDCLRHSKSCLNSSRNSSGMASKKLEST